jgi:hypothetical protein
MCKENLILGSFNDAARRSIYVVQNGKIISGHVMWKVVVVTSLEVPCRHLSWVNEETLDQKDEGTLDDRGRDGGTNFILRIKEQETRLTLHVHDDDDDFRFKFKTSLQRNRPT